MLLESGGEVRGDTVRTEIWYPRQRPVRFVEIDLIDVRATDGLRIHYSFERNGWVVEQASTFEWEMDQPIDYDWQEVSFVPSWGREKK